MWKALQDKRLATLFYATLVSQIGTQIHRIALLVLVYTLTQDALWLSAILITQLAATIGLGPLLSAWADGQDYRRLLIVSDWLRAPLVLLIPAAAQLSPWALLVVVALLEALRSLHDPITHAVIPSLVPAELLDSANSLTLFTQRFAEVAIAGLAGVLVAAAGPAPAFWIDALSFGVSGLILLGLPALKPETGQRAGYWARVRGGLGHLARQPIVRRTVVTLFAAAMFGSVETVLGVVLAVSVLNAGATGFGVLEGALALGAVASTFVVPHLTARIPRERLFVLSLVAFGLVEASIGAFPVFGWALAAYLLSGVLNMLFLIPARSLLQLHTPPELRARVFSAFGAVMQAAVVIGTLLGGALEKPLGAPRVFLLAGVLVSLVSVGVWLAGRSAAAAAQKNEIGQAQSA